MTALENLVTNTLRDFDKIRIFGNYRVGNYLITVFHYFKIAYYSPYFTYFLSSFVSKMNYLQIFSLAFSLKSTKSSRSWPLFVDFLFSLVILSSKQFMNFYSPWPLFICECAPRNVPQGISLVMPLSIFGVHCGPLRTIRAILSRFVPFCPVWSHLVSFWPGFDHQGHTVKGLQPTYVLLGSSVPP